MRLLVCLPRLLSRCTPLVTGGGELGCWLWKGRTSAWAQVYGVGLETRAEILAQAGIVNRGRCGCRRGRCVCARGSTGVHGGLGAWSKIPAPARAGVGKVCVEGPRIEPKTGTAIWVLVTPCPWVCSVDPRLQRWLPCFDAPDREPKDQKSSSPRQATQRAETSGNEDLIPQFKLSGREKVDA